MCKGIDLYTLENKVLGAIDMLREMNLSDEEIADRIAKKFNVTVEYVKELMMPKAV